MSEKSGMNAPRVMVADIPVPNAFAYNSLIAGSRVAVTTGLLKTLEEEEAEAVVGHELGHLKHRDVQVMMFVSILPAIFYFIGYSMLLIDRSEFSPELTVSELFLRNLRTPLSSFLASLGMFHRNPQTSNALENARISSDA